MAHRQRPKPYDATRRAQLRRMHRLHPWIGWWIDPADPRTRGRLRKYHPPLIGKADAEQRRAEWRRYRLAVKRAMRDDTPLPRFRGDWAD